MSKKTPSLSDRIEELSLDLPSSERSVFVNVAMRRAASLRKQGLSDVDILAELGDKKAEKKQKSIVYRFIRSRWTIVSIVAAIGLMAAAGVFAWSTVVDSIKPGSVSAIGVNEVPQKEDEGVSEFGGTQNILFVGTDFRNGDNKYNEGTNNEVDGLRTDALMLAMIPHDRSRVTILSFPRDSNVTVQNCHSYDLESKEYGGLLPETRDVKINSVYQRGGPACLVSTISDLTGIAIDSYVEADFSAFVEAVNAVGGVTVCPKEPIIDDQLGVVTARAGKQTIKGRTALQYVRARKVEGTSKTDYDRIARQQEVVMSVFRKVKSKGVLQDPSQLLELIGVMSRNIRIDGIDTNGLVNLANSLRNLPESRFIVQTAPITGRETPDGNVILDTAKLATIAELAADKEASDGSFSTATTLPRKQVDITIKTQNVNSAKVKKFAAELEKAGFGSVSIVRSSSPTPRESYVAWSKGNGNSSATVVQAVQDMGVYRSSETGNIGATIISGIDIGDLTVSRGYRSGIDAKLPNASGRKMTYQQVFGLISSSKSDGPSRAATNAKAESCG